MNKKKIRFSICVVVIIAVGIIVFIGLQKKENKDYEKFLKHFEQAVEDVLGEDIQQISKTKLVTTLTYSNQTDTDNNIYYRILKTTYYDTGAYKAVTGLNTEALNVLFQVDLMDSCEEMMIRDWHGAVYKKDDIAFLCWTYDPEVTYVLEYIPSKVSDSEIIKMAESVALVEE